MPFHSIEIERSRLANLQSPILREPCFTSHCPDYRQTTSNPEIVFFALYRDLSRVACGQCTRAADAIHFTKQARLKFEIKPPLTSKSDCWSEDDEHL